MGLREDLQKRIDRKRAEITDLETQIRLAQEYLQALEDTLKLVPRDGNGSTASESRVTLRPGTALFKAREAIRKAGRPMHVTELLEAMGKGTSRNEKAGLSGTLATYVRRGEIFTRPAPNTFGLVKTKTEPTDDLGFPLEPEPVPPKGFGKL